MHVCGKVDWLKYYIQGREIKYERPLYPRSLVKAAVCSLDALSNIFAVSSSRAAIKFTGRSKAYIIITTQVGRQGGWAVLARYGR